MIDNPTDIDEQAVELENLKQKANVMGISYHPSIGVEKLRAKIQAKLDEEGAEVEVESSAQVSSAPAPVMTAEQRKERERMKARHRALEQVRVRVTCMDPSKKEYEGEIFCAGNAVIGTVKKFVPFETVWHVPRILLNMIKNRQYQTFYYVKTPDGKKIKKTRLVKAFAIEELPPMTESELRELRQRQLMAQGSDE